MSQKISIHAYFQTTNLTTFLTTFECEIWVCWWTTMNNHRQSEWSENRMNTTKKSCLWTLTNNPIHSCGRWDFFHESALSLQFSQTDYYNDYFITVYLIMSKKLIICPDQKELPEITGMNLQSLEAPDHMKILKL